MKRRWYHLGITLLVAGALSLPLAILTQPQTARAQDDAAATLDEAHNAWPTYSDNFGRENALWDVDFESTDSNMTFDDGTYHVAVHDPSLFAWGMAQASATNLLIEADAQRVAGPVDNEFGIVFRHQDNDNFYAYMTSSDGYFKLRKLEDGSWSDILPWAESDLIDQSEGAVNRIGVLADGTTITLLINGEIAGEVEDSTFASGGVALAAGAFDEGGVEVAFDDFAMWDLDVVRGEASLVTPEPTETAEPTAEPTAVMAPMPPLPTTAPDFTDEFRSDSGAWDTDPLDGVSFTIRSREFTIRVDNPNAVGWSIWDVSQGAADFVFQVDASLVSGPEASEYGIFFREQDTENFYFYAVQPNGAFSLWKLIDNQWSEILPWTSSSALLTGIEAINRIGVQTQGSSIWLLANDEVVGQVDDTAIASGSLGVGVGTFDEAGAEYVFDNADLWLLSESVAPVETPIAEATPVAEATPEPPDVAVQLEAIREFEPAAIDEFRRDNGAWSAASGENSRFFYEARSFHERIDAANRVEWSTNEDLQVSDFLAEIDVAHVEGPENAQQGIIFRYADGDNFYFYAISANGYYLLLKRSNGEWQTLVDWTAATNLNVGPHSVNRIGVLAEGDVLTLLANGTALQQVTDEGIAEGALGVGAGTFDVSGLEVSFDNLNVWDLSQQ